MIINIVKTYKCVMCKTGNNKYIVKVRTSNIIWHISHLQL